MYSFVILHPESDVEITDELNGVYSKFILINDNLFELNQKFIYIINVENRDYTIFELDQNFSRIKTFTSKLSKIIFDPSSLPISEENKGKVLNSQLVYKKKDIYTITRNFNKEKKCFNTLGKNYKLNIYDYYTFNSYILFYCEKMSFKTMFFFTTGLSFNSLLKQSMTNKNFIQCKLDQNYSLINDENEIFFNNNVRYKQFFNPDIYNVFFKSFNYILILLLFLLFPSLLKGLLLLILNLFLKELCNYYTINLDNTLIYNADKNRNTTCFITNSLEEFLGSNSIVDPNGYIQQYVLAGTFAILFIYFPRLNEIINKYLNPFKSIFIRNYISLPLKNDIIEKTYFEHKNLYLFLSNKYMNYVRDAFIILDFIFITLSFSFVFYGSFQIFNEIAYKLGSESKILQTLVDFQKLTKSVPSFIPLIVFYFSINVWKNNIEFITHFFKFKSKFEQKYFKEDLCKTYNLFSPFYGLREESKKANLLYTFRYDLVKKTSENNEYLDKNYFRNCLNHNSKYLILSNLVSFVIFSIVPTLTYFYTSVNFFFDDTGSSFLYSVSLLFIIINVIIEVFIINYFVKWMYLQRVNFLKEKVL